MWLKINFTENVMKFGYYIKTNDTKTGVAEENGNIVLGVEIKIFN